MPRQRLRDAKLGPGQAERPARTQPAVGAGAERDHGVRGRAGAQRRRDRVRQRPAAGRRPARGGERDGPAPAVLRHDGEARLLAGDIAHDAFQQPGLAQPVAKPCVDRHQPPRAVTGGGREGFADQSDMAARRLRDSGLDRNQEVVRLLLQCLFQRLRIVEQQGDGRDRAIATAQPVQPCVARASHFGTHRCRNCLDGHTPNGGDRPGDAAIAAMARTTCPGHSGEKTWASETFVGSWDWPHS